jgi:hypothetical protein
LLAYQDLRSVLPTPAGWLAEEPALMMPILNAAAFEVAAGRCSNYSCTFDEVFISVTDLPV